MKKCLNRVTLEGYIYQHTLEVKTVQNQASENFGKEFINGQIDIVVDDEGLNIVPVRYTYVVPTTSKGATNRTYGVLKGIMENGKTWLECGSNATKVKCDTVFALNDFYAQDGTLVSQMVQEGGFISTIADFTKDSQGNYTARNKFEIDLLITKFTRVEADDENGTPEFGKVHAAGFNFRNQILPMDFIIKNPKGLDHLDDLDISGGNPIFVKAWGVINHISTKVNKVEESAFGESMVTSYDKKVREWIITGISPTPYDFGEENVLTVEEVQNALQDREVLLADVKKRADEYRASKAATPAAPAVAPKATTATFNF